MKRAFSKGVAWMAAASWLEQLFNVLTFLLISRLIGTEALGIASMAFAFLFLGEIMVRETLTEDIVARADLDDRRLNATFVVLMGFGGAVALLLVGLALASGWLYGEPAVTPLLLASTPTVLMIAAAGVPVALLRRRMEFRSLALRATLGVVIGGLVGLWMAYRGFGAWALIGQRLTQVAVNTVFAIAAARWRPNAIPARGDLSLVRGLGPRVVALRALTLIVNQTPTVALGMFAGPAAVGLYAFAARLAEIVLFVMVRPLKLVAQSSIAALQRDGKPTADFFLDLTELVAMLGLAAYVGLALVAHPTVALLVGQEWADASALLPWICAASAVAGLTQLQEAYLMAIDRLGAFVRAAAIEATIGIVIVGIAATQGPVAAVAAFALRALIGLILRTPAALRPELITPAQFASAVTAPLAAAAGMGAVVALWRVFALGALNDALYLICAVGLGMAAYAAIVLIALPRLGQKLLAFAR